MAAPPKTTLREATVADGVAACRLLRRLGLTLPDSDAGKAAHVERLWRDNPALARAKARPAIGWVLEDGDKMVGFFGSVPLMYHFNGKPLVVADASHWGVEPEYRSEAPRLADAYFAQKHVDLLLVTTAIKPTGRIFERHGAARVPQPDLERILYWVLDGGGFVRAGMRKKGAGAAAAWFLGSLGGMALNARVRLAGRRPFAALDDVTIARADDIDDAFDALWRAKLKEYPGRLLACRDAETLRWYFGLSQAAAATRFACVRRSGRLLGYAALVREDSTVIGLRRLKIADMLVLGDDEATATALLAAAYEYGIAKRCHVVELIGLPEPLRNHALAAKPMARPMATFPFYYKALRPDLVGPLGSGDGWYVTAYDGDTALL